MQRRTLSEIFENHGPRIFENQCPKTFCDFGLFNRLAQAGGGLLYEFSPSKSHRPKLLKSKLFFSNHFEQSISKETIVANLT
jgi:hypothetical protein